MILQRLATAIRRQDWFQVLIEVLIVIVGIFLGLQVQGWYEEQAERKQERAYLERLHSEVINIIATQQQRSTARPAEIMRNEFGTSLGEAINIIGGAETNIAFNAVHCRAIRLSHTYAPPVNNMATLNELISSGKLDIIESVKLKLALSEFSLATEDILENLEHLNDVVLVMPRKYPDLIKFDISDGTEQLSSVCDYQEMANRQDFINDVLDNYAKQTSYGTRFIKQQQTMEAILNVLEEELGISKTLGGET